ncbi:DUF4272 domain-containing protein [Labrenzia sp. VG12]|uniref:DUF4272 domain-containing protein n=1 Tax=Labrenzia sp. VG12 TaxID=2021862 RepID=UPI000B8BCBC6|nr:DUF4272 domain-containing protein [Labrenzia sp. VG12]ASP33606.1 hypothetical protein CHH27_10400 [Labrenzia sp. VG12]
MRAVLRFLTLGLIPMMIVSMVSAMAEEAAERKARSIEILRSEGVKYIDHLPKIETVDESLRRTEEEVVRRTLALAIVAVKAESDDYSLGQELIAQFGAEGYFTPHEEAFMKDRAPTEHERIQFVWCYEAVHVLLWAMGIYDEIGSLGVITDVPVLAETLRDLGPDGLRARASLRSQAELLDAADLIYRYHWAVVDARINGRAAPTSLDPGVVYERHYTLNWLIGYSDQPWDDISTDT